MGVFAIEADLSIDNCIYQERMYCASIKSWFYTPTSTGRLRGYLHLNISDPMKYSDLILASIDDRDSQAPRLLNGGSADNCSSVTKEHDLVYWTKVATQRLDLTLVNLAALIVMVTSPADVQSRL